MALLRWCSVFCCCCSCPFSSLIAECEAQLEQNFKCAKNFKFSTAKQFLRQRRLLRFIFSFCCFLYIYFFLWSVLLFLFVVLSVSFFRDWIIYKLRQKPVLAATATTTTECSMNLSALAKLCSGCHCLLPQKSLLAARWQNENKQQREETDNDEDNDNDNDNETRQTNEQNATPSYRVGQSRPVGQLSWHLGAGDKAIKTPTKHTEHSAVRERARGREKSGEYNQIELIKQTLQFISDKTYPINRFVFFFFAIYIHIEIYYISYAVFRFAYTAKLSWSHSVWVLRIRYNTSISIIYVMYVYLNSSTFIHILNTFDCRSVFYVFSPSLKISLLFDQSNVFLMVSSFISARNIPKLRCKFVATSCD